MTMLSKDKDPTKTDTGVPFPSGYIIVAFQNADDANRVRAALLDGGLPEREVLHMTAQRVAERTSQQIEEAGLVANAGYSIRALRTHHQLAKEGCDFLLIYAPEADDQTRVMETVNKVPYRLAQKYHRLTIEDL